MNVKHPVLKYYGSKFRLAEWIITHFPAAHRHYVEPFGGAGNVLLVKEPSRLETYNDLNDKIVNFFRVLRSQPEALIEQINLTPWARIEYENCLIEVEEETPLESARRLFYRLWMSYSGQYRTDRGSWRRFNKGTKRLRPVNMVENMHAASRRLFDVQIENRDAFRLIAETDSVDTLFYLDPPYVFSTRTTSKAYSHEMTNDKHREFAELLYGLQGFVVLSGYPSEIYAELFERRGWLRVDRAAKVMGGATKTESVWLSPRTSRALGLISD
ncbi:MAG TPA: DNA adenine methylase [Pyrinomonadaceae bacterium]|jgi:DNA adenine methylase